MTILEPGALAESRGLQGARWACALLAAIALAVYFRDGLTNIVAAWSEAEYSHGYLIPVIALLLAYQTRDEWLRPSRGSWAGLALLVCGITVGFLGRLSALFVLIEYGFLIALSGVALAFAGWRGIGALVVPLAYLIFMIPLPDFVLNNLSQQLQLISSAIGVWFIQLFGISVYLQGNVIDLGVYQLQVADACSGLRYLFPLMSFGFLCAYLYRGPLWHKALLFLSSIAITIVMNSLRIGIIGVLVEYSGIEAAEGFLHDFEGWAVFMVCVGLLFLEIALLAPMQRPPKTFFAAFNLDLRRRHG